MSDIGDKALQYIKFYASDMQTLQLQREKALKQYMCDPYGNEEEGRSQVVTSDIFDTIETVMPYLCKLFYGGQEVAKFSGAGEGDEDGAKLLGELVNFFVQKKMQGFVLFHDWMKESLINRMSVLKYWYEKREDKKKKEYKGLSEVEFELLVGREDIEILSVKENIADGEPDPMTGETSPGEKTYDVVANKITKVSHPDAEAIPSEAFIFNVRAKNISDSPCGHIIRKHKADIIKEYGIPEDQIIEETNKFLTDPVYIERYKDLGGISFLRDGDSDYYYIYEMYLDDYDKKGNKQPKKVVIMGNRVISEEDNSYGEPPFIEISPIRLPHRAVGLGIAQILEDIQKIRTALFRAILDNIYFQNNGREAFDPQKVDIDMLMDGNRPGGKIPVRPGTDPRLAVFPLPVTPLAQQTVEMLDKVDEMRQDRSGINRYVQGDDKGLNKTAFGVNTLLNQALQRQEMLARTFAETGFAKFYKRIAELTIEYMDEPQAIRLNGEWKTIDPNSIDVDFDVNIDVGIGTGSKDVVVQQMMQMLQVSLPLVQLGIVTPDNLFNVLKTIYENMGYKNVQEFVTQPQAQLGGMNVQQYIGAQAGAGAQGAGVGVPQTASPGIAPQPPSGGVPQFNPTSPVR